MMLLKICNYITCMAAYCVIILVVIVVPVPSQNNGWSCKRRLGLSNFPFSTTLRFYLDGEVFFCFVIHFIM